MKERYQLGLILLLFFCFAGQGWAQQPEGLSKGNLPQQLNALVEESRSYEKYKVVPQAWLNTFGINLQDTLDAHQQSFKKNQYTIDIQKDNIDSLKTKNVELNNRTKTLEQEKNSLSFLGVAINKSVYHVLVWAIIAGLSVALAIFLGRFRYAISSSRKIRSENQELQDKIDQMRRRMLEKEQELRRQLQDEINKRLG